MAEEKKIKPVTINKGKATPKKRDASKKAGDSVQWESKDDAYTLEFKNGWPFAGTQHAISVPANEPSQAYAVATKGDFTYVISVVNPSGPGVPPDVPTVSVGD